MYAKVKTLLDDNARRESMAKKAYETIVNEWNAENAAKKFLILAERILQGETRPFPFDEGICSKA